MKIKFLLLFLLVQATFLSAAAELNVVHYTAQIEPVIATESITGIVTITFAAHPANDRDAAFEFACGNLQIDSAYNETDKIAVVQEKKKVRGNLRDLRWVDSLATIRFYYHGKPAGGIHFLKEQDQVYTVYTTSDWMVCNSNLIDKATFDLQLIVPQNMRAVASGDFISSYTLVSGKSQQSWSVKAAVPAYTYGFSIGNFNEFTQQHKNVTLRSLGTAQPETELARIFKETGSMIDFFEQRSGVPFPGKSYTQVIVEGNDSQEMAGFCVLWNGYGKQVTDDSMKVNLSAHELAHQWWGNNITCETWRHFWLNEGLAVYMSSAYKEFRFGREQYLKDIEFYCTKYESVPNKPLVFPDWNSPTREDRTIVYFKGAYVFHLLREKLGDEIFWKGIRIYSQKHFGGFVTSVDLQKAMEEAGGVGVESFFEEWVY
jgi:aminopeptidase N